MFLELNFSADVFYAKSPNLNFGPSSISFPTFRTPRQKKHLLHFSTIKICDKINVGLVDRFPKWYIMTSQHQNSQSSLGPWKWAFCRPDTWWRGPWNRLTYPTIQLLSLANPEKFSMFHALFKKLFIFYFQTDRCTFYIHICMGRFLLCRNVYFSLHCVPLFAYLTHLLSL